MARTVKTAKTARITRRILILTGDCAESLEVMYPLQRLREAGFAPEIATPKGKLVRSVIHDFEPEFETYTEKPGYRIPADLSFEMVNPNHYDGLVIPGGRAPEYIRNDGKAIQIVDHFMKSKKPVAAICHAAQLLIAAGYCSNTKLTCYPALRPDVERAGGTFVDAEVVVSGNLVTSRAWPDHPGFMREFLKMLS
jgi:protease I